jgi:hypothetical protein
MPRARSLRKAEPSHATERDHGRARPVSPRVSGMASCPAVLGARGTPCYASTAGLEARPPMPMQCGSAKPGTRDRTLHRLAIGAGTIVLLSLSNAGSAQQSCGQCARSFQYVCMRHYGSCLQGCARAADRDTCQRQCAATSQLCAQNAAANCGICGPQDLSQGWSVRTPQRPPQLTPDIPATQPLRPRP